MTRCAYCNSTILFGGLRVGDHTYCNTRCRLRAQTLHLPPADRDVADLHAIITALHEDLLHLADEVHETRTALAEINERVDFLERSVSQLKAAGGT
jgi:hypothetical protein